MINYMSGRAVVIELNEVPLRVIGDVAAQGRAPFLAGLLDQNLLVQTRIDERLDRELYPSQTWASLGTGVPYDSHGVWWYNDPKPTQFPFYWQLAAGHRSVGLVNVLHSSPLAHRCADGDYRFVVPDCFAADAATLPARYEGFQRLNLQLTERNSRQARLSFDRSQARAVADAVASLPLRAPTVARLLGLIAGVGAGRIPRERIRSAQFMILSDVFLRLLNDEAPDLAVFFTNHVAAAMHRYWYAMYPGDFDHAHYDQQWVSRHRREIVFAVECADRFLGDVASWCRLNNRTMIVVSSMGQGPSRRLDTGRRLEAVIRHPEVFLDGVGVDGPWEVLGAMTPNVTVRFPTAEAAVAAAELLESVTDGRERSGVDISGPVVTFSYNLEVLGPETVSLGGSVATAKDVGVEILEVEDHSSGRHTPYGVLGVYNSSRFSASGLGDVDVFEVAPAMLELLGVRPTAHHRSPGFLL